MDTLEKELHNLGFSDNLIKVVEDAEMFDSPKSFITDINFQSFNNEVVSSTDLEVTSIPISYTNYVIEAEGNE